MPGIERRLSPRKHCMIPLRFRILANARVDFAMAGPRAPQDWRRETAGHFGPLDGEVVNLSAGGIGFKSREKLAVGDRIEMYLTIPPSITGKNFEHTHCKAHVVRVEDHTDVRGLNGVGAVIDLSEGVAALVAQVRFG